MKNENQIHIPNHYSATLSKLDLEMAVNIPPGGNWKNIPTTVESQRVHQIRESYAAGEGSRSTYYGRLHPERPAYTINTYFTRPGNGCHLHYDFEGGQHRVLSHREAARLQSFPDDFVFQGSKSSIAKQIGNAVPPLLAYQIARQVPFQGQVLDLFCGAGGLSLGFKWAGFKFIVGNDIDSSFLRTYAANIHNNTVCGDIRESKVFDLLTKQVKDAQKKSRLPLIILGGPPCQGFSTAGKRRTMDDDRNTLFREYVRLIDVLQPDLFVFENVAGLLNMEGGKVFEMVKRAFSKHVGQLISWKLQAEEFGVPQRRTRVILVGTRKQKLQIDQPQPLTSLNPEESLFKLRPAVSVYSAISDLPSLNPGEDGSSKRYRSRPTNSYQRLMRGLIGPEEYVKGFART